MSGTLVSPRISSGPKETDEPTYLPGCQSSLNFTVRLVTQAFQVDFCLVTQAFQVDL